MTNNAQEKPFEGFEPANTTPVPDILFDELLTELSGPELKILLYIIRRTLGFKKEIDGISLNQFENGITTKEGKQLDKGCGVAERRTIIKALKSLENKGCIKTVKSKTSEGDCATTLYSIHFRVVVNKQLPVVAKEQLPVVVENISPVVAKSTLGVVAKNPPTRNSIQETVLQENIVPQENKTEPSKETKQANATSRAIPSEKTTKPQLTSEGQELYLAWCSIFKAKVPTSDAIVKAANALAEPIATWADTLKVPKAEVLKKIKDWMYKQDKNGYYERGIKLYDVQRDFEGWQSAAERELAKRSLQLVSSSEHKGPKTMQEAKARGFNTGPMVRVPTKAERKRQEMQSRKVAVE